ncbi:MAG: hypothetical protein JEY94_15075 [Melioribacteraceae bacterium]|nr:hypothetical protein [Melioribacteraceae bacterium]
MKKKIFSLLLLISVINFAQETFGPVNSDYRMSLWRNYSGSPMWDGELKTEYAEIPIGYVHGSKINRWQ